METYKTYSEEETTAKGSQFGQHLPNNSIVCFRGDLGAGKTTFIKGIVKAFAKESQGQAITSPTFVYLNIYEGTKTVYHFDLYRLHDADEFLSMGFDELLFAEGICCIEWSERIARLLPPNCTFIDIEHVEENIRHISISTK